MKQLTFAPRHHQLTNINVWTPDSRWLAFDVRPSGASFTGETIERVNVETGEVEVIYRGREGAHVGVVTVSPTAERYVFIHGPENPDDAWRYDFHHRPRPPLAEYGRWWWKTAWRGISMRWRLRRRSPPARCAAAAMCMSSARTARG
ncbi:Uncharacterized protein YidR [Cronobacter dublinensis 582]|nr:Uncharacterized protein YidR [Cronobacter dublinensis 582]